MRILLLVSALLLAPLAVAQDSTDFVRQAQERLKVLGFYDGPVNGDFGPYTQAALAQFQLANVLPASGSLDAETSFALGIARDASAAGGETAAPAENSTPEASSPAS
ncbi:MAG TPA: peptidoglycan-binding domain-containing protein [Burkholderiales bacterium]